MGKLLILLLFPLLLSGCTSTPHYIVKGNIDGSDKLVFYLQSRETGEIRIIDSAQSKNGKFKLSKGSVLYPQMVQLIAGDTRKRTSFYLENSRITITGKLDSLYKAKIAGSKTQDEYQSYIDSNKSLSDIYSRLYIEYQAASQAGEYARTAKIRREADSIQTEMINLQKSFLKNNPSSFVSPSILGSLSYEMEADEIESIINAMDSAVASVPEVKLLKDRVAAMKTVAIGKKAPDFTLNDVNGNPLTLSSKIGSKLLLIDFWAAWCGPCRIENPNLVKIYNQFHGKGFDVFGVSLDQNKKDWIKAIADDKLMWTQVSDLQYWNNTAARLYVVNSIPANFLLDNSGTIIARNLRGEELYNKVIEVLGPGK